MPVSQSGRQLRQASQRRNRNLAIAAVAIVVAALLVLVIIGVTSSSSGGQARRPASASAVSKLKNISVSTLTAAVAKVGSNNLSPAIPAKGGAVTMAVKPDLLFIGAEYCPYCAVERWAIVIALSKFGTFTNLQQTHSGVSDGNIGTWSFYGSTYTSPYFTFTPVEMYTNQRSGSFYKTLETPDKAQKQLWLANTGQGSYPFIDFNGRAVITTAQANYLAFEQKSFSDILRSVGSNDNTIGAETNAASAVFMKHLCDMIDNNAPVCSQVANVPAPVASAASNG